MNPEAVVNAMISAMERKDLTEAGTYMADDIEYDNVPMGKVHGRDAVVASLGPFLGRCQGVEWVIKHQAVSGDVVMNERVDRFQFGDRWAEIAVAGLFVVREGKVALWRDYFDLAAAQTALS
jgi:limonene-1,2-epoxide hydrolase